MNTTPTRPDPDDDLVVETRVCADCDLEFTITAREARWFQVRNMHTPRRCQPCRKARRLADGQYDRQGLPVLRTR